MAEGKKEIPVRLSLSEEKEDSVKKQAGNFTDNVPLQSWGFHQLLCEKVLESE